MEIVGKERKRRRRDGAVEKEKGGREGWRER